MAKAAFVVIGIKEIDKKLRKLPAAIGKKVLRKAMRSGMKVVKTAVQDETSSFKEPTGLTRSAVKVKAIKRSRSRIGLDVRISAKVPGLKKDSAKGPVFYPAVVQYGRKGVPPNPFMTRAFTAKGKTARDITLKELKDGIEKEVKKL